MYDPYNPNPYETEKPGKISIEFKRRRGSSKKTGIGTVNAGGAVVIIIFVVLCLTIFGILSFATAFADKKLADKTLLSVSQYYGADSEAEEKLAVFYEALHNKIQASGNNLAFDESFVRAAISESAFYTPDEITVYEPYIEDLADGVSVVAVCFNTGMGSSGAGDKEVKFSLKSEIEFYYNAGMNELAYKITEWRAAVDSDFAYGEGELDLWIPDPDGW